MLRLFLIIGLVFFANRLPAQQKEVDSLVQLLQQHPAEDTLRLNRLNELAFSYYASDPDKGLIIADQAIALARKIGHKTKLAGAYTNKGTNYYAKGDDSLALDMYGQALLLHQQSGNRLGVAKTYNNMALVYVDRSDYQQALECHDKALKALRLLGDSSRIAASLTNIGVVYLRLSDYPRALEYYLEALQLYEKLHNNDVMANTLTNIGIVYKNLGNFPLALQYHEKALKILTVSGNQQGIAGCLANMGVVYDQLGNTDKALALYQQALVINESIGNNRRIASDLSNIGMLYKGKSDYTNALSFLMKALRLYEQTTDLNSLSIVLDEIGSIYTIAPAAALKQYQVPLSARYARALSFQQRSLQLATDIGALDRQAATWGHLSETYTATGAFEKALHAYKQYALLKDSILNDKKSNEIARKEIQFEFEKKQALVQAAYEKRQVVAAAEVKRQLVVKRSLIGGLAGLIVGGSWIFVLYKKSRDVEAKRKEADYNTHVADTEMKVLRLQMNPHFIFNSLNAISDYISKHDTRAADSYLSKFAKVMRMILENSDQKEVSLADDLKALELYMQLESLRLPCPFTYNITVGENIDQETTMVPPMILQPFVENSIWHGLSKKQGAGKINIQISREEDMLTCTAEDNGIGRTQAGTVTAGTGKRSMGMQITASRIDIINKTKKTNATVALSDLKEGTRVLVKLPFEVNN